MNDTVTWQPIATEWLDDWLGYIDSQAAGAIWAATMGDVTRYVIQRDNSACIMQDQSADHQTYEFTDNLDDTTYDHALTVMFPMPAGWSNATVTQNGQSMPVTMVMHNGVPHVQADVVPDAGFVTLANADSVPTAVSLQTQQASSLWTLMLVGLLFVGCSLTAWVVSRQRSFVAVGT